MHSYVGLQNKTSRCVPNYAPLVCEEYEFSSLAMPVKKRGESPNNSGWSLKVWSDPALIQPWMSIKNYTFPKIPIFLIGWGICRLISQYVDTIHKWNVQAKSKGLTKDYFGRLGVEWVIIQCCIYINLQLCISIILFTSCIAASLETLQKSLCLVGILTRLWIIHVPKMNKYIVHRR